MLMRVHRATGQMGQLIDDLLKLSRIDRSPPVLSDVNLSEIARNIGETLRERAPDRHVRMTIHPDIHARCDGRLTAIILTNLLENAWKFTARTPAPEVEFGQIQIGGNRTYLVRDNGAGFEMAYSDKLFQPFQRLHCVDEFPGTGIGLATVARVIRAHGGKVWAEAEPDKGATFYFQLGDAPALIGAIRPANKDRESAEAEDRIVKLARTG